MIENPQFKDTYTGTLNGEMLGRIFNSLSIADLILVAVRSSTDWKMFEGEMLIRTISTISLQILCRVTLTFQVIFKHINDPDGNS